VKDDKIPETCQAQRQVGVPPLGGLFSTSSAGTKKTPPEGGTPTQTGLSRRFRLILTF